MAKLLSLLLATTSVLLAKSLNLRCPEPCLELAAASPPISSSPRNQSVNDIHLALNVSALFPVCYGSSEEPILYTDQCMEALVNSDFASLPPTETLTFVPRTPLSPPGQIGLPRRYHSSDGKCAIEPYLVPGAQSAYNTARRFNQAVNKILQECVENDGHRGGVALHTGGDNNMEVKVFSFKPNVQCYGSVDRRRMIPSCGNLADDMDASNDLMMFTYGLSTIESVSLPYTELDPGGGGCGLRIFFDKPKQYPIQYSSWYSIWEAVVAINGMCIRNGQKGRWKAIGYTLDFPGIINVEVGEEDAEEDRASVTATA